MAKWWIGCSGFHYNHWKSLFYPEKLAKSKWFDYYNNRFTTLELNVTFYRFPRLPYLQAWYAQSPDNFKFSVKAPRAITHYRKFVNAEKFLSDFYTTVQEGLKEKLGCVLFQMPERIAYKEQKLEQIIESVHPQFKNVLEFRNETWWNAHVFNRLAANNITFCGMSHPSLPPDVIQNTNILYYRFHGVPQLYKSKYDAEQLHRFAYEVENITAVKDAFVYFNNDIDASAITNALDMQSYTETLQKRIVTK